MKAGKRRCARAIAALLPVLACLAWAPAGASLPQGLPELPLYGELMQRDPLSGLALSGFDPIAYRSAGAAIAGSPSHELVADGVVWRFSSAANLAAFRDAPSAYRPAFGGFDPTGIAAGHAVDSDPRIFAVSGGRLFLFRSEENRRRFLSEADLLERAEGSWPALLVTLAR